MGKYEPTLLVVDTETGGLSPDKHALIEIACCPIDIHLKDLEEYTVIISPYNDDLTYEDGALQINGITKEQINSGKSSKLVISELCDYLTKLKRGRSKPIICGQNLKFDIGFLEAFFKFHKKDLWKFLDKENQIDTLKWGRLKHIELPNFKLGTLCTEDNIELVEAHRAIVDTRATKELVKTYISSLRHGAKQSEQQRYRTTFEI